MVFVTTTGLTIAVNPKISVIFTMFDPMTFPIAISAVAPGATVSEETKLTANSGSDVPKATKVNPMTRGETLNLRAIELEEVTKKSAPLTRKIKPTKK